jgi:hypothetical protein
MAHYRYTLQTEEINPPVGGVYSYAARLARVIKSSQGREEAVNPNLGEVVGKTETEAIDKMTQQIERWIAIQEKPYCE